MDITNSPGTKLNSDILWTASKNSGEPILIFLLPKVEICLECSNKVYSSTESVTRITYFTLNGPVLGLKASLRCKHCGTRYGLDKYHLLNGQSIFCSTLYQHSFYEASNKVYFDKDPFELFCESR